MIRLSVLFRALPAVLLLAVLAVSGCCSGGGAAAPDAPPNPFHRDAGAR